MHECAPGLGSDCATLSSSEVITDCQEGLQQQQYPPVLDKKQADPLFPGLRAVTSHTINGTLRRIVLLQNNNHCQSAGPDGGDTRVFSAV